MKQLLTLALVLTSATAFATRSRVISLGSSPHILDTALSSPDQLLPLADSVTIESGNTATALALNAPVPTTNAQGSLYKTMGDGKLGVVLGRQDSLVWANRSNYAPLVATMDAQQNPLEISYAMKMTDLNVGFGLIYSNYENKTVGALEKESSMGITAGASNSVFYINGKMMLTDKYTQEATTTDYKGKPGFDIKAGYYFGDLSVHANIVSTGSKVAVGGTDVAEIDQMDMTVKVIDTIKKDNNFFYGVGLQSLSKKEKVNTPENKKSSMSLPVIIGMEVPANSWLTFRGALTQNVMISTEKTEGGGTFFGADADKAPGDNTTTLATGLGIAFNKITIDGSILAGGTQTINSGNLLTTVGVAYNF